MVELEHARAMLSDMGLSTSAHLLDAQIERSTGSHHTYAQFLDELLSFEKQERDRKNLEFRIRRAHLPYVRRIEEFDFSFQPSIDKRLVDELATTAFAKRGENVILLGPPGVGKTHLAVGLAMKVLEDGMSVNFTTLAHMIMDLEHSASARRWSTYRNPALLIIDEVGYMQLDRSQAEILFRIVAERYEQGSIIFTSNKYFSDWGELLNDSVIATAVLDRLLHHAHVINIRGQSYRLKDRLAAGAFSPASEPSGGKRTGAKEPGDFGHF
ncbi:MAG: IS21-like element helper ATPase IstB [Acidaminococcaceae bacterium]|nr:IS21-like element helper ATPase IstB [Acidaminococcaceae bacterium]